MLRLPLTITPEEMLNIGQLPQSELKEKYVFLYQDFLTLKKFTKSQEDKITRLQTKLQKLTHDTFRSNKAEISSMKGLRLKYEGEIEDLKSTISLMSSRIEILQGKLKVASVQLSTAKERKRPSFYRHIPPRVDSGLKRHSLVSRSLTNVTNDLRKARDVKEKSRSSFDLSLDGGNSLADIHNPTGIWFRNADIDKNVNENNQKSLLDDSQKKIKELEKGHEDLLQQMIEGQQLAEEREEILKKKVEELIRKQQQGEKDVDGLKTLSSNSHSSENFQLNTDDIRTNARVTVLTEHITQLQEHLNEVTKCKETALEELEKMKLEFNKKDGFLRENKLLFDKMKDDVREVNAINKHLKEQVELLEDENKKLSNFQQHIPNGRTKIPNFEKEELAPFSQDQQLNINTRDQDVNSSEKKQLSYRTIIDQHNEKLRDASEERKYIENSRFVNTNKDVFYMQMPCTSASRDAGNIDPQIRCSSSYEDNQPIGNFKDYQFENGLLKVSTNGNLTTQRDAILEDNLRQRNFSMLDFGQHRQEEDVSGSYLAKIKELQMRLEV